MRSRTTNILQGIVLITGLIYSVTGILFYISPLLFGSIFGIQVPEDWFNQIKLDSFMLPLYFITQGFAALLFVTGLSMVLPLFDPFRYRGLIYFTGVIFPVMASIMLTKNGLRYEHWMVIIMGVTFGIIFVITALGLLITKKNAESGEE